MIFPRILVWSAALENLSSLLLEVANFTRFKACSAIKLDADEAMLISLFLDVGSGGRE